MKMYSYQLSNFAGKCRVAAYEKGSISSSLIRAKTLDKKSTRKSTLPARFRPWKPTTDSSLPSRRSLTSIWRINSRRRRYCRAMRKAKLRSVP